MAAPARESKYRITFFQTLGDSSHTAAVSWCAEEKSTGHARASRAGDALARLLRCSDRIACPSEELDASVVLVDALAPLVPLLCLDRQRGDRARLQPLERDRLAGLFAIAVGAVFDAGERLLDLGNQLALAIARSQFDRPVGLGRRTISQVGMILIFILQVLQSFLCLLQNIVLPVEQLLAEVLPLAIVHERLFVGWPVVLVRRTHMTIFGGGALLVLVVCILVRTHDFPM